MHVYGDLHGTLTSPGRISGSLSGNKTIAGNLTIPSAILPPSYEGDYEVTPSEEAQTLATDSLYMRGNVIINPIPNNYGLVSWNGSGTSIVIT